MHHPTDRITHTSLCYTSRGALAGTRNSSMCPLHEESIRRPIAPWANALTTELHLASSPWMEALPWSYISILQGRKEMFYLTMHSTHFIYSYMGREREMFYLTMHSTHFIYGYMASDMVKDHFDSEKGNPLPPHRLLFPINSNGSFICTIPQTG